MILTKKDIDKLVQSYTDKADDHAQSNLESSKMFNKGAAYALQDLWDNRQSYGNEGDYKDSIEKSAKDTINRLEQELKTLKDYMFRRSEPEPLTADISLGQRAACLIACDRYIAAVQKQEKSQKNGSSSLVFLCENARRKAHRSLLESFDLQETDELACITIDNLDSLNYDAGELYKALVAQSNDLTQEVD